MLGVAARVQLSKCVIAVWPEDIRAAKTNSFPGGWNVLRGMIEERTMLGSSVSVSVDVGFPVKVVMSRRSFEEIDLQDEVWLGFDPASVKIVGGDAETN